jgi:energy-converting hydrogenase Eha subunit B
VLFALVSNPIASIGVQLLEVITGAVLAVMTAVVIADVTRGTGRVMLGTPFAVRYGARWADALPQIQSNGTDKKNGFSWWTLLCASSAYSGRSLAKGFNTAMQSLHGCTLEATCTLIQPS